MNDEWGSEKNKLKLIKHKQKTNETVGGKNYGN
jgi:hypothetical protein